MRFSDIKTRHLYNVIFDPVRNCEFNGKHLGLVLKRNNDRKTFIVMPLTSEPNGEGVNKISLGKINTLPTSLKNNNTYAVFNQIRTVNANRFIALKEGQTIIESKIEDKVFTKLLYLGTKEIMFNLTQDEKIELFKIAYEKECINKAKNLAYNILKLKNQIEDKEHKIESMKQEIKDTLNNVPYNSKGLDDAIKNIIDDIFKDN